MLELSVFLDGGSITAAAFEYMSSTRVNRWSDGENTWGPGSDSWGFETIEYSGRWDNVIRGPEGIKVNYDLIGGIKSKLMGLEDQINEATSEQSRLEFEEWKKEQRGKLNEEIADKT